MPELGGGGRRLPEWHSTNVAPSLDRGNPLWDDSFMPAGIHLKKARTFRPDPELYERAMAAVKEVDSTMNDHVNGFLSWLVRDTDELPARPPAKPDDSK